MRVGIGKLSLKRKKYLHHDYRIDGEDLPQEKNRINKKALAISSVAVLFPIGAINFVAGSYQTIIKELSKQLRNQLFLMWLVQSGKIVYR